MNWLTIILITEMAVILACLVSVLGRALWLNVYGERRRSRAYLAEATLGRYINSGWLSEGGLKTLHDLPTRQKIALYCKFYSVMKGEARDQMIRLADDLGLRKEAARRCKSHFWTRRLSGVRLFTLIGVGEESVIPLFQDGKEEVRAAAAEWGASHPQPEVVGRLVDLLGDESALCRFTVKDSLLRLGKSASPVLKKRLSVDSPSEEALRIATWIADPALFEAACNLRLHPLPRIRALAIEMVAAIGGLTATEVLTEAARDNDVVVRAVALRALGRMKHWQSASLLVKGLSDDDWEVRREAGFALNAIGTAGTLLLRKALESSDQSAVDIARHILDLQSLASQSEIENDK